MSIQLFKNWLVECQTKDPIFFEAATAAFEAMFETTEDVLKIAEQNLGKDEKIEDMGLDDIDSILGQDNTSELGDEDMGEFDNDIEQSDPNADKDPNDMTDEDWEKLLGDSDSDDGEDLDVPDLDKIPSLK